MQDLAGAVVIFIDSGVGLAVFRYFLCDFIGRDHRNRGVMDYAAISGKDLAGLDPPVFREVCGDVDVFVIVHGCARHGELGDGEHHVGLDVPALGQYGSRREIFGSPSLAPVRTQASMVAISASLRRGSFTKSPTLGSACQGGILRCTTASRMESAQGRASLKVISDMGAMSLGRWQVTQFL